MKPLEPEELERLLAGAPIPKHLRLTNPQANQVAVLAGQGDQQALGILWANFQPFLHSLADEALPNRPDIHDDVVAGFSEVLKRIARGYRPDLSDFFQHLKVKCTQERYQLIRRLADPVHVGRRELHAHQPVAVSTRDESGDSLGDQLASGPFDEAPPSALDQLIEHETQGRLRESVEELPDPQRQIIQRLFGIGCRTRNKTRIAMELRLTQQQLEEALAKGLRQLRETMEDDEDE